VKPDVAISAPGSFKKGEGRAIVLKDRRTAMVGMLALVLFLSSLILTNPGKALAVDAFLKVDQIPGESADAKHKEWIDVISWSFGETQSATAAGRSAGGASAERVKMQDFKITMRMSKASPKLFESGANGKRIKEVQLDVCKSGGAKERFLNIKLTDVIVSSLVNLGSSGGGDAYPTEEIMFNFGKIEITYTQQKRADGSGGGDVKTGYDATANKVY
jgi:type VI secretion system secreted protein Hcp